MRLLVWNWGRRGAGPIFAAGLARALDALPETEAVLSLSYYAEIMRGTQPPFCDLPVVTYLGPVGLVWRVLQMWLLPARLTGRVRKARPDAAVCAMSGPLDLMMADALHRLGVTLAVVVHDADAHPGDGFPFQMALQRRLIRRAAALVALTRHVAERLTAQGLVGERRLVVGALPPLDDSPPPPAPPRARGGPLRLLFFGRLRQYKGLDMLGDALRRLGPRADLVVRVVGQGPDDPGLSRLAALPGVTVENRWVPEAERGALIAWSDAVVLPYREASQSGVASDALAAGRWVIATRVGGLAEQVEAGGGIVCAPDPAAIAEAIVGLLEHPPPPPRPMDAEAAWRELAAIVRSAVA